VASEVLLYWINRGAPNMQLPFSRAEFFDVLAAYNSALWPIVVALWIASALACTSLWLRRSHDRWMSGLLAVHWVWSAFAYHLAFFTRVNPAAWLFAAVFLLQAALFVWYGLVKKSLSFASARSGWTPLGWLLIGYALLYPVINGVEQGSVLKSPTFGLPCPTTIFTAGLLLLASSPSPILSVVPIIWGVIGGSAAILLGVSADYALPIAAAVLVAFQLQTSRPPSSSSRPVSLPHRPVEGHVARGFEPVGKAFADNFTLRGELGGACCAYSRGKNVVDVWGGLRNTQTGEPWEQNTMVVVHSATKGLAAMTLALAHSRRWLDYDERVCTYWPEFAQQGKERITVRQLLAHQAGLFAINEPVGRDLVADLDRLAIVLARQKPAWEPGTRQAYHALTLGFYESELLRRVDPRRRSLGQFFQDEIASPLGLDLYLRLPDTIPNSRLATMAAPNFMKVLLGFPVRFALEAMNPRSNIYRALVVNPGTAVYSDNQRIYARNLEVPSGNAVGTARAIARAYSVFATGGRELGLRKETLDLLAAPAIPPTHGFYDECLKGEVQFSLGFMKPCATWPFGSAGSFGSPGSGGSLGFADPALGIGYAYVTSQMGTTLTGDPRDVALREAFYSVLPTLSGRSPAAA